ncbi:MAG TPA: HAMP domain-containing sensor histidine kinase [Polyangiaceae bacterium]|nr:HAMP domain-containing sensor histidine kinase [Polyangiaceae bacterium]
MVGGWNVAPSGQVRSLRRVLFLGGSIYMAWWFVVRAVLPDAYNALAGRLVVVGIFYAAPAASFYSEWTRRHLEECLFAAICVLTLHYYYLVERNGGDTAWAVGAYIVLAGASSLLSSRRALFAYSILTIALGTAVSLLSPALLRSIFLAGLATMTFLSNVTLRNRLLLEEERAALARTEAARVAAEANVVLRDEFISIASHELNTPLAALKLQFKQLARGVAPPGGGSAPETVRSYLDRCERQLDRIARLVETLLDASRVTAGPVALRLEEVALLEVVRDAVQALASDAERAGSTIEVSGDAAVVGRWDPVRLGQVVTNLVRNALTFGGGRPVRITVSGDPRIARLSVVDQGVGIASDQHDRIFRRFQRAVSVQNYGGLGLGLYVVKQVVDAHGGSVDVDSEPGKGATFTVRLPRGASAAPPATGLQAS